MTTAESIQQGCVDDDGRNLVDSLDSVSHSLRTIANAIKPTAAMPGRDENGGVVDSLTEAIMGVTSGLHAIAAAIREHD